jgi:hypothetical protein
MLRVLRILVMTAAAWVLCAPALADARSLWADTRRDEDLKVSLVTFGTGGEIHQYFGHNALLVEDTEREIAALYNFGMFSFGPDMLPKYLRGQLEFWSAATPVQATYRHYMAENRSIRVRELNLPPAKRRYLAERLAYYTQPEHRSYLYHHYFNNCSTKVRDMIDAATDGQLKRMYSTPATLTFRGETRRYTEHDPIVHMLLLLWMNDSMEKPIQRWDEAFLPDELERMVDDAKYEDASGKLVPLVSASYTVYDAHRPPIPEAPSAAWPGLLAVGVLVGGIAYALSRWVEKGSRFARALLGLHHMILGVVIGVPGTVLFLFLFTAWDVTHHNENLFIANPLTLLMFPLGCWMAFGSKRAQRWAGTLWLVLGASTLLLLVLKALPMFDQDNHLINVGCALAHYGLLKKPRAVAAPIAADGASHA